MAFFRSEEMTLCTILLHKDCAFDSIAELGTLNIVQFNNLVDENFKPGLGFTGEVRRCSELQRILQNLQNEFEKTDIKYIYYPDADEEMPQSKDLKEIEMILLNLDEEVVAVQKNYEGLMINKGIVEEKLAVLMRASEFMHSDRNTEAVMAWSDSVMMSLLHDEVRRESPQAKLDNLKLGFITGSIPIERYFGFERVLWRMSRGNYFMRHAEIEFMTENDRRGGTKVRKVVFMVYFQGNVMRDKIVKLCQGYGITLYECPESREERRDRILRAKNDIADLKKILDDTDDHLRRLLQIAAADYFLWKVKVSRCMAVYFALNKLGTIEHLNNQKYLQAECWIPTPDVPTVREALIRASDRSAKGDTFLAFPPILIENDKPRKRVPPTFFRLNRLTMGFQALVDAYGIAVYGELNPAPYTIITFPFLFAVMFGDIGHGLIMAIFGIWMVLKEKKLEYQRRVSAKESEIWNIMFSGRYIIMLMGIFSIYTGFLYNDIFSKGLHFAESSWRVNYDEETVRDNDFLTLDPALKENYIGTPCIFGVDVAWHSGAENSIVNSNSFKMKVAIILGIAQMVFGLLLSATNLIYSKHYGDLVLVCAPQLLFLLCVFVYLVFLIFYKWSNYGGHYESPYNSACAPSVLITFIDMVMMKESPPGPEGCKKLMYEGQPTLQFVLLLIAFICIPVMLAGKPILLLVTRRKIKKIQDQRLKELVRQNTRESLRRSLVYNIENEKKSPEEPEKMDIGEVCIHQGIHTIESVLGAVSHTASYLRLWALSLAHAQLSSVLWNMVLGPFLKEESWANGVYLYVAFWAWSFLTLAILVVMEGLSAFLHTLRLHWVEFQSKFFDGTGERFIPFHFERIRRD